MLQFPGQRTSLLDTRPEGTSLVGRLGDSQIQILIIVGIMGRCLMRKTNRLKSMAPDLSSDDDDGFLHEVLAEGQLVVILVERAVGSALALD